MLHLWSALNPWGLTLAHVLINVLWQSTLLLAAIGILTWALRKRPASLRHALWVGAILLIPLLPAVSRVLASTRVPQVPVRVKAVALPPVAEPAAASSAELAHFSAIPGGTSAEPPILQMYGRPWTVVILLYAFCLMRMLGWFGTGLFRLRQWIRRAVPVTEARVLAALELARELLGLSRRVEVVVSSDVPTALTLGLLKPMVLLAKNDLENLTDSDVQKILLHECAHVRRHDNLWLRLTLLVRTTFFFQPLIWWACRQAALLAEESCDEAVVASTGEALPYADLLTRLAERTVLPSMSTRMATGLLFIRSAFVQRMEAIIVQSRAHFRQPSRLMVGSTLLAALLCVAVAVALPLNGEGKSGTFSACGKVVDDKGNPLAEAQVYACTSDNVAQGFILKAKTQTNKDGEFQFEGLPTRKNGEWNCLLNAWKQGYAWASTTQGYSPERGSPSKSAGGISNAILKLISPADFAGRVLDRQGQPIAGARISAFFDYKSNDRIVASYWVWPGGGSFGAVLTDTEGRFRFDSVPAKSECRLEVAADGYGMIGINSYLDSSMRGPNPSRPFFHVDGKDAEVRLGPESRILGSVFEAKSGKPLAEIAVSAFENTHLAQAFMKTDAGGHFVVKGIPAGTYRLKASLPEGNSYRVPVVSVQVSEGEVREGVELKAEEGVRLVGRVLDKSTGKPLEHAGVICSLPVEKMEAGQTLTDAQGEFHFIVVPGTYDVLARCPGYDFANCSTAVPAEANGEVRLADFLLGPTTTETEKNVSVLVVDEQGKPAGGVKVSYKAFSLLGTTGPDGCLKFDISRFVTDPDPWLRLTSSGGDLAAVWIFSAEELANPPAQKQIALKKAGSIQGTILAVDGKPIRAVGVTLWMHIRAVQSPDETLMSQDLKAVSNADGTYRIRGLVPDMTYDVSAAGPAGSKTGTARHENFSAEPGETLLMPEIILPRAERTVSGRFLDEQGKPVVELSFRVEGAQTRWRDLSTGKDGRFEIQDVATEKLRLYLTDNRAQLFENQRFEIPKENLQQDLSDLVFTVKRK